MSFVTRQSQSFAASAPDQRADGGVRTIRLDRRGVRIERLVAGIKMHLAVPIHAYQGVMLSCDDRPGQRLCQIALLHHDPELCVLLHEAPESPAILAVWRSWADFFAKPALYREPQATAAGTLAPRGNSSPRPRRRGTQLTARRPRFLKRRRGGSFSKRASLFPAARQTRACD